ncbi:DUF4336 domain-containing protein [Roseomonas xinghualingensis]|uniref:DUF4336 domain-containing protein n=1 Tax=Roseomonas xinghualingensis TaxID=2986475 RepID=UPI0021F1692F|nr:DUF4336 domain-containing protein [Roseomonas sp. SXEYE001]MCV4208260.1 DUF4336 domain-containing protein [Roseomonas sp. SXEYE001]
MITTRLHGLIDYGVAAILGGLSTCPTLPPAVRRALGTAGAYHAGYSLLTDYEGGVRPVLSMRQHLALDAIGGAALIGAGITMRREPDEARALLIGIGLAELAVVAFSSAAPRRGPGQGSGPIGRLLARDDHAIAHQVGYPPFDTPKPVAQDIHIVDSLLPNAMGAAIGARMTVIRLPDGDLLLHSPTRYSRGLHRELERIGRIAHLVAPNFAHWTFLKDWAEACPKAVTWAAPGLRERSQVKRSGVRLDYDLGDSAPAAWGGVIEMVPVPGGAGFHEMAMFHQPSRTLVLTDLVMNLEAHKVPLPLRPLAWAFGMLAPDGMPPPYLRAVVRRRHPEAAEAASRLIALQPERVIFSHGKWFERNGTEALRRSFRWLLAQDHEELEVRHGVEPLKPTASGTTIATEPL